MLVRQRFSVGWRTFNMIKSVESHNDSKRICKDSFILNSIYKRYMSRRKVDDDAYQNALNAF